MPVLSHTFKTKSPPSLTHLSFNVFINNPALYENLYFFTHLHLSQRPPPTRSLVPYA